MIVTLFSKQALRLDKVRPIHPDSGSQRGSLACSRGTQRCYLPRVQFRKCTSDREARSAAFQSRTLWCSYSRVCRGNFFGAGGGGVIKRKQENKAMNRDSRCSRIQRLLRGLRVRKEGGWLYGFSQEGYNRSVCGNQIRSGGVAREECSATAVCGGQTKRQNSERNSLSGRG